ncbi:MAG TPA: hypothetical protein PL182_08940 [Pseudobdellovibrionaceae bacterium]|nr:hypothetical protein [Pseudobdellovibrionaceae bacterium]
MFFKHRSCSNPKFVFSGCGGGLAFLRTRSSMSYAGIFRKLWITQEVPRSFLGGFVLGLIVGVGLSEKRIMLPGCSPKSQPTAASGKNEF